MATPHQLVDLLFQGAREQLNLAHGHIHRGDHAGRSAAINAVVDILSGLQASLDFENGEDIAANLDSLYDYMQRRLFRANSDNDVDGVLEVTDLIDTLRSAWRAIDPDSAVSAG